jgi:23S rRNA G2445 N2-methylase RlmL
MLVDRLRLVGPFGSNTVMAGEASRLARRAFDDFRRTEPKKDGPSSLVYPFDARLAALLISYHRTSARILWDLYESDAERLEPLYDEIREAVADDERSLWFDGADISVSTFGVEDFAAGERQIVGTVKNALLDGAKDRGLSLGVDPAEPDFFVQVRLVDGRIVVSLDLVGRPMHERGYRLSRGDAPLREDLAALLVMLARFDPKHEALIDPMAGSGTIAIEAALMARASPVWGSGRLPLGRDIRALSPHFAGLEKPLFADTSPRIWANEIDQGAARALTNNAARAGVSGDLEVSVGDFRALDPGAILADGRSRGLERALIVSNPPHGHRMQTNPAELEALYADLGAWCRRFAGSRAAFIAPESFERVFASKRSLGKIPRVKKPLFDGSLRVWFFAYEL